MDYLVTGSRAYGSYTEDSDLDIAMEKTDADKLFSLLKSTGLKIEIHQSQFIYTDKVWYFSIGPIKINVISLHSKIDLACWRETTLRMTELPMIQDKGRRVAFFKSTFADVYDTYPASVAIDRLRDRFVDDFDEDEAVDVPVEIG